VGEGFGLGEFLNTTTVCLVKVFPVGGPMPVQRKLMTGATTDSTPKQTTITQIGEKESSPMMTLVLLFNRLMMAVHGTPTTPAPNPN
jgi:hypothetical protein